MRTVMFGFMHVLNISPVLASQAGDKNAKAVLKHVNPKKPRAGGKDPATEMGGRGLLKQPSMVEPRAW